MKECDKRKSHISSKLHMIYISSDNVRHPVTETFKASKHSVKSQKNGVFINTTAIILTLRVHKHVGEISGYVVDSFFPKDFLL
jgi:hypothetical protein